MKQFLTVLWVLAIPVQCFASSWCSCTGEVSVAGPGDFPGFAERYSMSVINPEVKLLKIEPGQLHCRGFGCCPDSKSTEPIFVTPLRLPDRGDMYQFQGKRSEFEQLTHYKKLLVTLTCQEISESTQEKILKIERDF